MSTRSRSFGAALLVAGSLTWAACATSVNSVLANPARYRDRDVKVSGNVADSVSLGSRGAFRLQDRSGSLWVISDVGVPRKGARVSVTGRIHDTFDVNIFGGRLGLPGGLSSGVVMIASSRPD